jgi:hypothetical protein
LSRAAQFGNLANPSEHGSRGVVSGFAETPMTVRRMKTYTGGQGYVYQYYFVGQRPARASEGDATEFIFDVTSNRKTTFAVSVFLRRDAVEAWNTRHGRALNDAEQYGAVKMRLFQAFDEIENMLVEGRRLMVDTEALEQSLTTLGVA